MHLLTKWLNRMVKVFPAFFILIIAVADAQPVTHLTLEEVNQLARQNYPVIKQKDLIRQTAVLNIANLNKGYLPQFNISGQATYQSDVTSVDIPIPNLKIESPSKDQYKVLVDISQLVYDGGAIMQQNEMQELNAAVEQQKVEVELYKLRQQIDQLFLGVLYLNAQMQQVALVENNIQVGVKNVQAQVENGIAFHSNLNVLKAELLKVQQRMIELKASRQGMIETLELFINRPLTGDVVFDKPVIKSTNGDSTITRPEIKLYSSQETLFDHQSKIIKAKNQPKASLFLQGGYGRPALNLLKNQFDFFYIAGIRFNWSLSGLYTKKRENELVEINKRTVNIQQETFLLNTTAQLKQQQSEIDKMKGLIESDEQIISLRASVTEAAKAQLQNGVITANDFLKEVNDEDQARQTLITHQIQLLQAQINYQTISGK